MHKSVTLIPIFDTYAQFTQNTERQYEMDRPFLTKYLDSFNSQFDARSDYEAVRRFLKSNSRVQTTYNNYRTQVERLLLWAWLKQGKPVLGLLRSDMEEFMGFCCSPDPSWIGKAIKSRYITEQGCLVPNPSWRPFTMRTSKASSKVAKEELRDVPAPTFKMSSGSIGQVYAAINSFFHYCISEQLIGANPCALIGKNKSKWTGRDLVLAKPKALTKLQWEFVIETAELMAEEKPKKGERTLFAIVMMFSCYLRVSDLVGNGTWRPTMGSFQKSNSGWWYHVVGKGNVQDKIAVKPDCIHYLKRYRKHLGLPEYPAAGDSDPLLSTAHGRAGMTDRQLRKDVQAVLDRTVLKMQEEGFPEEDVSNLRSTSLHWFRHTGATFDAPYRSPKNLQADMRHKSLATTQNIYYSTLDDERAAEVEGLTIRR
tara:strand:+ start:37456 stop:38733 length:1278 start_codon:yes stop_codon:yes gene_type:complete